ncbi:MAG: class I adenylate-forming enzyme family protein [bacterium]
MALRTQIVSTLTQAIQTTFQRIPHKVALKCKDQEFTFGQLDKLSNQVAQALCTLGIKKGDRVCIYLSNGIEFVLTYLANLKIGAMTVPVNFLYRETELRHILLDSGAKVLVAHASQIDMVKKVKTVSCSLETIIVVEGHTENSVIISFKDFMASGSPEPITAAIYPEDILGIFYTSGTTGRAKGAMLTQNNLLTNIQSLISTWELSEKDHFLLCLPLSHMHGLHNGLHGALVTGMTTILLERFHAETILDTLSREKCTLFYGVPTMYTRLLQVPNAGNKYDLSSMRLFVSGSAPLSKEDFKAFREKFGHTILERYGMTETAMNISNPYSDERRPASVGLPLPGVEIRLVNEKGKGCQTDEVGEIWIRGQNVFKAYWNLPEETKSAFSKEGWFKSGDLARRDSEGYYYIIGRKKDLIISGGYNIYPREIEECLLQHPQILECAVLGVPDPLKGEVVKCYLVCSEATTLTESQIIDYYNEKLASFKIPRKVVFLSKLPRTSSGKVLKHKLPDYDRL